MRLFLTMFFGLTITSQASTILAVLNPDTLIGAPGATLQFSGALANTTADTVFINADSFTFDIAGAVDDSPFLLNAPFFLNPNETSAPFPFLSVLIPLAQAPGVYDGAITIVGGIDANAQDNLGIASFHVQVSGVPEPVSGALVAVGLLLLAFCFKVLPLRRVSRPPD
ncbi:MAG: hypothetical protein ACRD9L_11885 [Bryobacteraceae bacterium]